ncbi:hypothetical protein [Streptomyces luteolus]|uniref:Translation elongation factor EFG/EF2 domain-containing protein n=1 Tax=Streptomyces luteolus TaxID=3043615 RepID=A0ABT6SPY9_9ACTN|nr:hypothetical protein [Streptomyces sp. B-S-A12]MDI3417674.1 hypothetical protein [Streptomyces sp. B-S-A12]
MTPALPRFPPHPIRDVRVLHQRQNCAPQFADITVDFEPAAEPGAGFTFEVADGIDVDYEPAEDLPGFFAAVATGIQEQLSLPEHPFVIAARVVLRKARADSFGSHERAFRVAGFLAARKAVAECTRLR